MSQPPKPARPAGEPEPADAPRPGGEGGDALEQAKELLARTVRFLSRCMQDPQAALDADDPRELIDGLRALGAERAAEPGAPSKAEPSPPIQIRRRRSA